MTGAQQYTLHRGRRWRVVDEDEHVHEPVEPTI